MDGNGRRSNKDDCCKIFTIIEPRIYYPRSPNESPGSGGTSAIEKGKKNVAGQSRKNYSSSKNANHPSDGAYGPHDLRRSTITKRNQYKSKSCVGCDYAHGNKVVDNEQNEIERIDEAEFRNKRTHSVSRTVPSTRHDLSGGYSGSTSRKFFDGGSKNISYVDLSRSFSPENVGRPDKSSSFVEKGRDDEDMDPEEIEIKIIDEVEFRNKKMHSVSKAGSSTRQELYKGYHADTSKKCVEGLSKKISSANLSGFVSPENADRDSVHGGPNKSSSFVERGIRNEDIVPEVIEIEKFEESQFMKTHCVSKKRPSTGQEITEGYCPATSLKNVDGVRKKMSFAGLWGSLSPRFAYSYSDREQPRKSSPLMEKGKHVKYRDPDNIEIERIDEAEFRNNKTHFASKMGPSTRQELYEGSSYEDMRSDFNGHLDKSSSFWKKEIMNQGAGVKFEKIDENRKKSTESMYSRMKKINEEWDILDDNANSYFFEWISSNSSLQSNRNFCLSDNINAFLQDDEISARDPGDEKDLDIVNRTRSKSRIVKRFPELANVSLDISAESNDKDSEEKTSSFSERWDLLCSYAEEFAIQNNTSLKVLAVKNEGCSKQKETAGNHASKSGCLSNLHNKQEKCNQHASGIHEFFFRKRKLSNDASSKRNKGGIAYKENDVPEENEDINKNLVDDAYEKEVLKKRRAGRREELPKWPNSEQLNTQKDCNAAGINELHSKDHLKDDSGHVDQSGYNNETKCSTKRKQVPSKQYVFGGVLADSVLERGQFREERESNEAAKQAAAPQIQNNLPLKFTFEDEAPKPVEKTEHEKEMEGLFAELDFCWTLTELDSCNLPEVDNGNPNALAEDTQCARCARGNHELVLQDDAGLRCIYCPHVELGPRDVMPLWAEKTRERSEKKRSSEIERCPEFDKLHLESSVDNSTDFSNDGNGTVWNFKPGIRESLYKHQQEGFEFLWKNLAGSINLAELKSSDPSGVGGCIISHAPGTGKTRLTIVFLETYLKLFPYCRPVIIAPASMLLTWEEEFRKWNVDFPFHNLNNLEFFGKENKTALQLLPGARRKNKDMSRMVKVYSWNAGRSILGISYSLYEKLAGQKNIGGKRSKKRKTVTGDTKSEALGKILLEKPELVILDEGHTPRNERSNIWNALLKLQTGKRVILSGTPFQNNFAELFNTLRLVRPAVADVLAKEKIFSTEMITSRKMNSMRKYVGKNHKSASISEVDSAVEKLKIAMSPFVHVHKGTILQQSLPGLRDCVVLLKPPALQKSLIERIEGYQTTFEFEHKVALISVHPYLLQFCGSTENQWLGIDMGSVKASKLNPNEGAKTKFIFELVRLSLAMNEKVLIFSQYIQPLELIKEQLKEIFKWVDGRQIFQMQGKLDQRQRQNMINIFNDPQSEAKVMLASTKCCSEGISLVGASRLVLLDVVWNPSVERQAISRAYRIGQKKFVYTYHLMTSGTTEGDKYCKQADKERLSELVFTSSSNESGKHPVASVEDVILEEMVDRARLSKMFEKIINHPKDTDLVQTFGLTS